MPALEETLATLLAPEVNNEDWVEQRSSTTDGAGSSRVGWLWTLVGLALLGAFVAFMVDDYPLRALISLN
jgi:MYXO-CTERM domain-containing protein